MSILVGIDWSLRSPAICVWEGGDVIMSNCKFYSLGNKPQQINSNGLDITIDKYPSYKTAYGRYQSLVNWALDCIVVHSPLPVRDTNIVIENYGFNANGRITDIAESIGVLKNSLYTLGYPFHTVSVSSVKKCLTGKGNASKDQNGELYPAPMGLKTAKSPWQDMVDAFGVLMAYQLIQ